MFELLNCILFQGDNMTQIDDAGRFRISPVSQSLVIFNTTENDLMRNYSCRISNRFDEKMLTYNASITRERTSNNLCYYYTACFVVFVAAKEVDILIAMCMTIKEFLSQ